jgi:UDP-N-acetylglucosamine 2-epimerase (non-hydrolysing)
LLDDAQAHALMARPAYPFGNGTAAAKILDGIEHYFSQGAPRDRSLLFVPV